MKKTIKFAFFLLPLVFMISCTIENRIYRNGVFIHFLPQKNERIVSSEFDSFSNAKIADVENLPDSSFVENKGVVQVSNRNLSEYSNYKSANIKQAIDFQPEIESSSSQKQLIKQSALTRAASNGLEPVPKLHPLVMVGFICLTLAIVFTMVNLSMGGVTAVVALLVAFGIIPLLIGIDRIRDNSDKWKGLIAAQIALLVLLVLLILNVLIGLSSISIHYNNTPWF